jgi:MbtH protein
MNQQRRTTVSANPFEDPDGRYLVLVNDEGQHSLWPLLTDVPAGWTVAFPETTREAALDYVRQNWTDMRPKSLIESMRSAPDHTAAPSP